MGIVPLRSCTMNKLEATLTIVIFALVLALIGACSYISDLHTENTKQRIELFKACVEDFGPRNCTFWSRNPILNWIGFIFYHYVGDVGISPLSEFYHGK